MTPNDIHAMQSDHQFHSNQAIEDASLSTVVFEFLAVAVD